MNRIYNEHLDDAESLIKRGQYSNAEILIKLSVARSLSEYQGLLADLIEAIKANQPKGESL